MFLSIVNWFRCPVIIERYFVNGKLTLIKVVAGREALWVPQRGQGVGWRVALWANKGRWKRNW